MMQLKFGVVNTIEHTLPYSMKPINFILGGWGGDRVLISESIALSLTMFRWRMHRKRETFSGLSPVSPDPDW